MESTRQLCESLARLHKPPRVVACASAIGYYGNRGDELLDEQSSPGSGFLAQVCRDWESSTAVAQRRGIRVAHLRFGIILTPRGGALAKMLKPLRLGICGRLGSGQQYMSWITMDDALGAIQSILTNDSLHGPINIVAPNPVPNYEFTKTLGRILSRPTWLPMPAWLLSLVMGEKAQEILLSSQRVLPARLQSSCYNFLHPQLEPALRHLLAMPEGE